MSLTTLLSNIPNLVKVLGLSAAVGTGGALAMQDATSPMDTTPVVSAERGPDHATGLERAGEKANEHAAEGLNRARAAKAAAAERRAERDNRGERPERAERGNRGERPERAERGNRGPDRESGRDMAESRRGGGRPS